RQGKVRAKDPLRRPPAIRRTFLRPLPIRFFGDDVRQPLFIAQQIAIKASHDVADAKRLGSNANRQQCERERAGNQSHDVTIPQTRPLAPWLETDEHQQPAEQNEGGWMSSASPGES